MPFGHHKRTAPAGTCSESVILDAALGGSAVGRVAVAPGMSNPVMAAENVPPVFPAGTPCGPATTCAVTFTVHPPAVASVSGAVG